MAKTLFQFFLTGGGTDKTTIVMVQRVRAKKDDDDPWYSIPREWSDVAHHPEIAALKPVKTAIATLKVNRGKSRTVNVGLEADILALYQDDEENYVFKGIALGECEFNEEPTTDVRLLADSLRHLQQREEPVNDIIKRLLIEKFSSKSKNVESWCRSFEAESVRFELSGTKPVSYTHLTLPTIYSV